MHPSAEVAAFLDDRNILTNSVEELCKILEDIKDFDDCAGHQTNVEKTAVFATSPRDRERLRRTRVRGDLLTVKLNDTMVGHDITTRRARRTTFLNGRAERATLRAAKVAASGMTRKQKTRLMQQAVIPMAVSGTLWELPAGRKIDGLRASTINAIWGRGRQRRSREIVLAVLNDAARTDPLAAMVYRRLDDARRLMAKDIHRYHYCRHLYEVTRGDIVQGSVFQKGGSGVMRGLHQAAALLGATLQMDEEGFVIDFGGAQLPLRLNSGSSTTWKARLQDAITRAITRQLAARRADPAEQNTDDRRGKRKDLHGIGTAIDVHATMANLSGRAVTVKKKYQALWSEAGLDPGCNKYYKDEVDRQRLQAVIAGSIRAQDRLHKAGLARSLVCSFCAHQFADLQHIIWCCPSWEAARAPYLKLIEALRARISEEPNGSARCEEITRLLNLPCVRNCGVMPESPYFKNGGPPLPHRSQKWLIRNSDYGDLTPREQDYLHRDAEGRVTVYTDGSAVHPTDRRRRRAAWGVFHAPGHPWNASGPVHQDCQTVFAAELMAATHAIVSASTPTRVVSDCRAVVNFIRDELAGRGAPIRGDYADMKEEIRRAVQNKPGGYYEVDWVNSHVDLELAEEIERRGGAAREHMLGNAQADLLAKSALQDHRINQLEYDMADDREALAVIVQSMIEAVWAQVFDADVNLRSLEDHAAEEAGESGPLGSEDEPDDADDGGHAPRNPLALSNPQLATFIRRAAPAYSWESPNAQDHAVQICYPDLPHYARLVRRGSTLIAGRGMVNMAFPYPTYYAEAIRWWMARLRWPTSPPPEPHSSSATTSAQLELVVDFELSTG